MLTDKAKEFIAKLLNEGQSYPVQAADQLLTFTGQTLFGKYEGDLNRNYYNYTNFLTDDQADLNDPLVNTATIVAVFIYANKKLVVVNEASNAVILVFDNETDTFLYRVRGHRTYSDPDADLLYPVLRVKFNEKTGDMYGLCEKNGSTHFFLIADFWSQYEGETTRKDVFYNILFDVENEVEPEDLDDDDEIPRFNEQFSLFRTDPDLISDFSVDFFNNFTFAFTWWDNTNDDIWVVRLQTDLGQASPKEALWMVNQKLVNPTVDVTATSTWSSVSALAIMTGDTYVDEDNTSMGSVLVSTAKGVDTFSNLPISGYDQTRDTFTTVYSTSKTPTISFPHFFTDTSIKYGNQKKWEVGRIITNNMFKDWLQPLTSVLQDPDVTITSVSFAVQATNYYKSDATAKILEFEGDVNKFMGAFYTGKTFRTDTFLDLVMKLENNSMSSNAYDNTIIFYEFLTGVDGTYKIPNKERDIIWWNGENIAPWDDEWQLVFTKDTDKYDYMGLLVNFLQNRPFGHFDRDSAVVGSLDIQNFYYGLPWPEKYVASFEDNAGKVFLSADDFNALTTWLFFYLPASFTSYYSVKGKKVEDIEVAVYYKDTDFYDDNLYSALAHYQPIKKPFDLVMSKQTMGDFFNDYEFWTDMEVNTKLTARLAFSGYRTTRVINDATTIQYTMNFNSEDNKLTFDQVQVINDAYDLKNAVFVSPTQLYANLKQKQQQDEYGLYYFSGINDLGSTGKTTVEYVSYELTGSSLMQITLVSCQEVKSVKINNVTLSTSDWKLVNENTIELYNVPNNALIEISYESKYVAPQLLDNFQASAYQNIVMKGVNNFAALGTNDVSVVGTGLTSASTWQPFLLWRDNDDLTYLNRVSQDVVQTTFTPPGTNLASAFLWRDDNLLNLSVLFQDTNFTKLDWQATYVNSLANPYPLTPYFDAKKDLFINGTNFRKTLDFTGSTGQYSDVFAKQILDVATSGPNTLAITNIAPVQMNDHSYTHNVTLFGETGQPLFYWDNQQLNKEPTELLQLNFNTKVFFLSDQNVVNITAQENLSLDLVLDFQMTGADKANVATNQVAEVGGDEATHTYRFQHLTKAAQHVVKWFNSTIDPIDFGGFVMTTKKGTTSGVAGFISFVKPQMLAFNIPVNGLEEQISIAYTPTGENLVTVDLPDTTKSYRVEGRIIVYGDVSELPDPVKKALAFT